MIEALVGKIEGLLGKTGLFEKDFLLASLLPVFMFLSSVALTLAGVIGFEAIGGWIEGWTAAGKLVLFVYGGITVIAFAFILHGLQTFLIRLWSGTIRLPLLIPFLQLGEKFQRARYHKLRQQADQPRKWEELADWFDKEVDEIYKTDKGKKLSIPGDKLLMLRREVSSLHEDMGKEEARSLLRDRMIDAHKKYAFRSLLDVQRSVREKLQNWKQKEQITTSTRRAELDRRFGVSQTIRATVLGNIVESYNVYPFKRYRIEGEIFWPRLQQVMKPEFLATIRESRILLHFWLALSTLSFLLGFLILLGGPWLWLNYKFLVLLTGGAFTVGYSFYRIAVSAVDQLGDLIRTSFDLFRLDLLSALYGEHPASLFLEQEKWKKIGQLIIFGEIAHDLRFRPRQT